MTKSEKATGGRQSKPKWEPSELQPLCKDKDCKCPAHPEFCCTQRRGKK